MTNDEKEKIIEEINRTCYEMCEHSELIDSRSYSIGLAQCIDIIRKFENTDISKHVVKKHTGNMVDHPAHYNREDSMECIDEMVTAFGTDATIHFCLCSAWKYRYRAELKGNAEEDIKKSDWYMKKARELKDKKRGIVRFRKDGIEIIKNPSQDDINKILGVDNVCKSE